MRAAILSSVRAKQLAIIIGTSTAASLLAGITMLIINLMDYHNTWVRDVFTQMELLGRSSTAALQFRDPEVARENLDLLVLRPEFQAAAIYDASGKLFASYVRRGYAADLPPLPGGDGYVTEMGAITAFRRIIDNNQILGTVYVKADYKLVANLLRNLAVVLAVTVAALLAAVYASGRLQALLIAPILAIARTARGVAARRDFSLRAEKMSNDEVGMLADTFNDMLAEIQRRTDQLEASNTALANEVAERRRVEEEVRRLNRELDERVQERTAQLQSANSELDAFTSSVSHDLRAPLRAIEGFSEALDKECGPDIPEPARQHLHRIRKAVERMSRLIEDLLTLSRLSRVDMHPQRLDISAMAAEVVAELRQASPQREVEVSIWDRLAAEGDPHLVRVVLENLLGNAWKYTSKTEHAWIEVGGTSHGRRTVFFVRDNGAGFNMDYADKLFVAFQRLHHPDEFEGIGVGLATVQRIIHRHGGRIWAEGEEGRGAVFFFTLESGGGDDDQEDASPRSSGG